MYYVARITNNIIGKIHLAPTHENAVYTATRIVEKWDTDFHFTFVQSFLEENNMYNCDDDSVVQIFTINE